MCLGAADERQRRIQRPAPRPALLPGMPPSGRRSDSRSWDPRSRMGRRSCSGGWRQPMLRREAAPTGRRSGCRSPFGVSNDDRQICADRSTALWLVDRAGVSLMTDGCTAAGRASLPAAVRTPAGLKALPCCARLAVRTSARSASRPAVRGPAARPSPRRRSWAFLSGCRGTLTVTMPAGRYVHGLTVVLSCSSSKCRCVPVLRPVLPIFPMASP